MITCSTAAQIVENNSIGKISEIDLSPYTNDEKCERETDIEPWMTPKMFKNINNDDSDKIVLGIKLNNTNGLTFAQICKRVAESGLLNDFYFYSYIKKPTSNNTYSVKLQKIGGKLTIAKIYPATKQYYLQPFEFFNKNLFAEVPDVIELNNKACYFGKPIIFEQ